MNETDPVREAKVRFGLAQKVKREQRREREAQRPVMPSNLSMEGRIEWFDAANGGNPIRDGETWLYPNGAWRDIDTKGILAFAPTEPLQAARAVLRYREVLVKNLELRFNDLKAALKLHAKLAIENNHDAPSESQIKQLESLCRQLRRARKDHREARKRLEELHPQSTAVGKVADADTVRQREKTLSRIMQISA